MQVQPRGHNLRWIPPFTAGHSWLDGSAMFAQSYTSKSWGCILLGRANEMPLSSSYWLLKIQQWETQSPPQPACSLLSPMVTKPSTRLLLSLQLQALWLCQALLGRYSHTCQLHQLRAVYSSWLTHSHWLSLVTPPPPPPLRTACKEVFSPGLF